VKNCASNLHQTFSKTLQLFNRLQVFSKPEQASY